METGKNVGWQTSDYILFLKLNLKGMYLNSKPAIPKADLNLETIPF